MTHEEYIKHCYYYKGEREDPYETDFGKSCWWRIEAYGDCRGGKPVADEKVTGELSRTMVGYITARVWECASPIMPYDLAMKRATELYRLGLWDCGYIRNKDCTLEQVKRYNKEENAKKYENYDRRTLYARKCN